MPLMHCRRFIKSLLISCLISLPVSASLIERDYLQLHDGGITYDNESGYEWLDLSYTRSMNLNQYQDYLSSSSDGWMFASSRMVDNLFTQFNLTQKINDRSGIHEVSEDNSSFGTYHSASGYSYYKPAEKAFIDLVSALTILGESMSEGSALFGIKGFTSDNINGAYEQYMAYHNGAKDLGILAFGDYHRVPTGKDIQSFFTYRIARPEVNFASLNISVPSTQVSEPTTLAIFTLMLSLFAFRRYQK